MDIITDKQLIRKTLNGWIGKHVSILWEADNARFGIDGILEQLTEAYDEMSDKWYDIAYRDDRTVYLGALGQFRVAAVYWICPDIFCIGLSKKPDWMVLKHAKEYRDGLASQP